MSTPALDVVRRDRPEPLSRVRILIVERVETHHFDQAEAEHALGEFVELLIARHFTQDQVDEAEAIYLIDSDGNVRAGLYIQGTSPGDVIGTSKEQG